MSGIAGFADRSASVAARQDAAARRPAADAQVVATAKQALDRAQNRVDADRRAHSPDCVAVDQKGVDEASAELAHLRTAENAAPTASRVLSITV